MNNRRRFTAAALSLPLLMLAGCFGDDQASVPDLPFTQLDGSAHRLSDLKGKVTLINFWATSCSTCVREMPQIVSTHQKYHAQGYETLAVAMDYDPPAYVAAFAQSRQLPFRVAIDHDGKLAQGFGPVQLTPTTFVVNKQGKIVKRYVGEPDFKALHTLIETLLAEG
ncbi:MAG TPA: TlpA disulfide reductase family protein [Aquabacterium sp.]|nr:TlpA disulfide reductase family protein [Aquabacterium sp.]HEX5373342.1 TlpA disulfide reductase family protein [Aquabacterium sp.]